MLILGIDSMKVISMFKETYDINLFNLESDQN